MFSLVTQTCANKQKTPPPVDGVDGQDCIPTHIAVTMFQAGTDRWHEGLQQLRLLQLAQEAQSGATDELVGMLEILEMYCIDGIFRLPEIQ